MFKYIHGSTLRIENFKHCDPAGGRQYWQIPSGGNTAGTNISRPEQGEHGIQRKGSPDSEENIENEKPQEKEIRISGKAL